MTAQGIHYVSIYVMFVTGWYVSSYGPLIPLYSQATGLDQTHFSYIFLVRSSANIAGGFLMKALLPLLTIRALLACLCTALAAALLACSLSYSTPSLILNLFTASMCFVIINIILVSLNFKVFNQQQAVKNIQFLGFIFGVGAFCGPFLIMLLQLHTYTALSLAALLILPLYLSQPLPQISQPPTDEPTQHRISRTSELYICLLMLLYATVELGMGSWMPTYAIKSQVSDIPHSGLYSLLFWLPNCICRILWIYVPLSFNTKLKCIIYSLAVIIALTLALQSLGHYRLVCWLGPIASGILLSNMYAFFLSLPSEHGYQFSSSNSTNFVIASCVGQGILITPIGYSISFFGFQSLIAIETLIAILMVFVYQLTLASLDHKPLANATTPLIPIQSSINQNSGTN